MGDGSGEALLPLESRPGIFLIGSPNVGKRTLLSRLLSIDFAEFPDLSDEIFCHGWTINTKYYSADLSIWTAQLDDEFSIWSLPAANHLAALVMVFDMSDMTSFVALQDWVSRTNIQNFEILLCIGNKVDLLPGHSVHVEYRRRLQKHGEYSSDPHPEYLDYGILETEGSSLLGEEEPCWVVRQSCLEWCSQCNIEYIEACASNADFDKCLSVDGDLQGVERLYGALSAHMWPGMVLKSGDKINEPSPVEKEEGSDEESDYEFEYEVLSRGSEDQWDGSGDSWYSFSDPPITASMGEGSSSREVPLGNIPDLKDKKGNGSEVQISTSEVIAAVSSVLSNNHPVETGMEESSVNGNTSTCDPKQDHEEESSSEVQIMKEHEDKAASEVKTPTSISAEQEDHGILAARTNELNEDTHLGFEDLERLMSEIANTRDNLRLMPDFQRREMAAKMAMKMAIMFGDNSDEDGFE